MDLPYKKSVQVNDSLGIQDPEKLKEHEAQADIFDENELDFGDYDSQAKFDEGDKRKRKREAREAKEQQNQFKIFDGENSKDGANGEISDTEFGSEVDEGREEVEEYLSRAKSQKKAKVDAKKARVALAEEEREKISDYLK